MSRPPSGGVLAEALDRVLSKEEPEASAIVRRALTADGIAVRTNTGTPPPSATRSRPPSLTRAISPIVNTDAAVASSMLAPSASRSAARHTQHPSMNDAVPVSTTVTGTSTWPATSWAAPTVADWLEPRWIDRIAVAPSAASAS